MNSVLKTLSLIIILFSGSLVADNAFFAVRGFGKKMNPLDPVSGKYADPVFTVNDSDIAVPGYMSGAQARMVLYLGDYVQLVGLCNSAYGGTGISDSLSYFEVISGQNSFHALDSYADAQGRIFLLNSLTVQGGMRYMLVYSQGDYGDDADVTVSGLQKSAGGVDSFTYIQKSYGYTGGINYVLNLIDVLYVNLHCGYTYFPYDNSSMKFELKGIANDTNESEFDLHSIEGSLGFRFLTPIDRMFEYEMGVAVSQNYYTIRHSDTFDERIHYDSKISYLDVMPYIELVFPLF